MGLYQFRIPTVEEAEHLLAQRRAEIEQRGSLQAEQFEDAVACRRRLVPVTTAAERAAAQAFNAAHPRRTHGEAK